MINLSIILPVHNESEIITKSVQDIAEVLKKLKLNYEILCVENGSTDDSYSKLQKLSTKDKHLKVFRSEKGWGNAVRVGIQKSTGIVTCYLVSDGQIDVSAIAQLYQKYKLNQNPKIVLWKVWRTTRENPTRFINSRIYNFLSRCLFNLPTYDVNATPKLMETGLLKSIPLTANNIAVDLELMLAIKKRGLSFVEIPVLSKKRESGESTTKLRTILEMINWMMKFLLVKNYGQS